jgi:hypothetical protein
MQMRGWVYQSKWMWKLGVPPLPLWLVGWLIIPLEWGRHRIKKGK